MKTTAPIEGLEPRIAPASIIFTDQDGDKVKITRSQGDLTGHVTQTMVAGVGSVYSLDLTDAEFDGDVRGGAGEFSGSVNVIAGGIGTKIIGGAVIPGTGPMSGVIVG